MCESKCFANRDFIGSMKLSDIIKVKIQSSPRREQSINGIIGAGSRQSLKTALDILNKNKLRCLPVFDESALSDEDDNQNLNYLGIVTIMDILCFLAFKNKNSEDSENFELCKLLGLAKEESESSTVWIYPSYHHFEVVLETYWKGTQTILVRYIADNVNKVVILSQTDVVRYLYHHMDKLGQDLLDKTVEEAGLLKNKHYHRSITVKSSKSAQIAFQQMYYYHRDSLAVIEEDDAKVLANISASDLRGITPLEFQQLDKVSVADFLKRNSPTGELRPAVVATEDTTVREMLTLVMEEHVHRLWIVNEDGQILTKIDLDDLIFLLCLSGHSHHRLNCKCDLNKD